MKKIALITLLALASTVLYASTPLRQDTNQGEKNVTGNRGEVVKMDKELFLRDVFDYKQSKQWNYKGTRPAIIDLYADWCGPCRMTAPIMKELAKEYADQIIIYKVDVDKERELASFFGASSIPLFILIPLKGDPQVIRGAAGKATYKQAIDGFLLKK
ncbi:MAG: redoxin domain-containing protein [Mediterranea sp.]|jgi:thioredoxin|nr:redoxin domain-containing protein [Mediterranea sp.]